MTEFQSFNVIDVDYQTPENGIEITEINIAEKDDNTPTPLIAALETAL